MIDNDIRPSQEFIEGKQRFEYSKSEVNWDARARPEELDIEHKLLSSLTEWLGNSIKEVTFGKEDALVGVSGGVDSTTTAYLVSEAFQQIKQKGSGTDQHLLLVSFTGNIEEDSRNFPTVVESIINSYPELNISSVTSDISGAINTIHASVDKLVEASGRKKVYAGELPTRVIYQHLIELANRIGYALVGSMNGTELILGEFSLGASSMISPLEFLFKSQVNELAKILNIPQPILARPGTDTDWGNDKINTYFKELPKDISPQHAYQVLDAVLYGLWALHHSPDKVAQDLGHDPKFVQRIYERIKSEEYSRKPPTFFTTGINVQYNSHLPESFNSREQQVMYDAAKSKN